MSRKMLIFVLTVAIALAVFQPVVAATSGPTKQGDNKLSKDQMADDGMPMSERFAFNVCKYGKAGTDYTSGMNQTFTYNGWEYELRYPPVNKVWETAILCQKTPLGYVLGGIPYNHPSYVNVYAVEILVGVEVYAVLYIVMDIHGAGITYVGTTLSKN